ncbi:MAG: hypothetical protein H0V79_10275 [Actinobacteria bacterium]|nr:hypothetical protein [Actinomycetota bacterium]
MRDVLRKLRKRLRIGSLQRSDLTSASERSVENYDAVDAVAAARLDDVDPAYGDAAGGIPPGYVKSYDEGRPRK